MTAWSDAHGTGRLGDDSVHVRAMRLHLDAQGRQELERLIAELLEEVAQIEAESADRLASAPRAPVYESRLSIVPFFGRGAAT
jgi:hypothetical protein